MSLPAIEIESLSKRYRLGLVGSGTLRDDLRGWWYRARGKPDPTLAIGRENRLEEEGERYIWALRDIGFSVEQGEVVGIIGKNGAGKSTLLKLLSRVTGPTGGVIRTRGQVASLLEVGTGMHPELTGRENIFLNGAILGMTRREVRGNFNEIVDFAGVASFIDTPVKRYSSGMRVRLGFAVAAHLDPEILIVDEVLAVGDAEFQKKAIGKMKEVSAGGGRTVLFVSHNMGSVENLCTRGIVLDRGNMVFDGSQSGAVEHYLTRIVRSGEAGGASGKAGTGGEDTTGTGTGGRPDGITGPITIDLLEAFDNRGKSLAYLKNGEDVLLKLNYRVLDAIDHLNDLQVSVRFTNDQGIRIFTHSNRLGERRYRADEVRNRNAFSVSIRNLPLPRGSYTIDTTIVHGQTIIDERVGLAGMEVIDGTYGSNLVNPHPVHGVCLVDAAWDIE